MANKSADDAQKFLASIVEHSEDAIIGFAPDGTIVSWNTGAEKLFGYGAQEIIGYWSSLAGCWRGAIRS